MMRAGRLTKQSDHGGVGARLNPTRQRRDSISFSYDTFLLFRAQDPNAARHAAGSFKAN